MKNHGTPLLNTPATRHIKSLAEIIPAYEVLLIDMVGVVHDGLSAYPGVVEQLNQLIAMKQVVILSNNPRPGYLSRHSLQKMGVSGQYTVITSGDYCRDYLVKNYSRQKVFHLGHQTNTDITKDLKINLTDELDKADCVLLTSFIEENQNPEQFDGTLEQITSQELPVLCANPDVYALYGKTLRKTAGFFANRLLEFGLPIAQLKILGKPSLDFYEYAAAQVPALHNKGSALMIGDTIETDIAGADNFGIDSLLTLSGITGLKINDHPNHLQSLQIIPTYTISKL